MSRVFIGLGSNLANPIQQIKQAVIGLKEIPLTAVEKVSSLYQSEPWGMTQQPAFINAVAELNTELTAVQLLKYLRQIEDKQQRDRKSKRYGPRTIDLDILLFEEIQINLPHLVIPHPFLMEREFVVYPLAEIAPHLILPNGEAIQDIQAQLPQKGLKKIIGESV